MPKRSPVTRRLARLVVSADFERALKTRSRATTTHFAMHHLSASSVAAPPLTDQVAACDLSTTPGITGASPVDESHAGAPSAAAQWLGAVVPKRHARRAVTRALLKRQIYAAGERHRRCLGSGVWVVRQRAPFERTAFPSAASDALKRCARAELDALFEAVGA